MLLYVIFLLGGLIGVAIGVHDWVTLGHLGLWDSILITLAFSFLVIGMDELIHLRRHRMNERVGAARVGH